MSWIVLLFAGVTIGLIMAVPVGPVNLLAISRTLRYGFWAGFVAGLGGMAADTLLAALSAFGITWAVDFVEVNARKIQFGGGALLVLMGLAAMRTHPHIDRSDLVASARGVLRGGLSAFFMTVTNPGAILAMIALFGSLGDIEDIRLGGISALVVVAGVAGGSTVWWFLLATMVGRLRDRLSDAWLATVNHVAGAVLALAGVALIVGLMLGIKLM